MRRLAPLILLILAGGALADEADKDLARQRYKTGQALFQRGRVADALHEFEEGQKSFALPEFDYNIGLCLSKLDRPAEAADALQRYMDARPDDPDAAGIWKMVAELRAEAVRRKAAAAKTEPVPSPQPALIAPPLRPPTVDHSREHRRSLQTKLGIAFAVVGGASLVAAIFTGVTALNDRTDYDRSCDQGRCNDDSFVSAQSVAGATDFLIPVGVALVVTSIALFATRPKLAARVAWNGVSF